MVGEQLNWWMVVTCCDQRVLRMGVYELRESRVHKACALTSVSHLDVTVEKKRW
jgi:hypothetical protein